MKKVVLIIEKIERVFIILFSILMVSAIFAQVVNRNILHLNIGWFEEVSRYSMIYMLMFATEMGMRDNTQLNVDSLVSRVPPPVVALFKTITTIVIIFFSIVIAVTSFRLLAMQYKFDARTASLGLPTYIPQAAVTLGFIFMAVTQTIGLGCNLVTEIKKMKKTGKQQ